MESLVTVVVGVVVQSLRYVQLFANPWRAAQQASLAFTVSWSLLKLSPSSQWCHPTISSSVIPFFSCLQSFPASGSFPVSQFFTSGDQSTGASASVCPKNIQDWFPTGKTIALNTQIFVGKVMFLLFNMLSRLVIAFLPRSKHLLISWRSHCLQWFWSPRR